MKTQFKVGSNRVVLLIFFAVALYASYWLVKPFLQPIVLAILIGMLAFRLHQRLVQAPPVSWRRTAALLAHRSERTADPIFRRDAPKE